MPLACTRRSLLLASAGLGAALVLPQARACEFFCTTLRVTHPWTRATKAGQTTAVVSMKIDEVLRTDRLIAVETPVAGGAVLAGGDGVDSDSFALVLPAGADTEIGESGPVLKLVGLKVPLEIGRTYDLRLTFEHGGVINADLSVDYE